MIAPTEKGKTIWKSLISLFREAEKRKKGEIGDETTTGSGLA
jgi:hypothetical protein